MIELITASDLAALETAVTGLTDTVAHLKDVQATDDSRHEALAQTVGKITIALEANGAVFETFNTALDGLVEDVSELQLQVTELQKQQQDIKDRIIETIVLVNTISERQQRLEQWLREKLTPKPPVEPTDQA